jgi:hypothetical protein
MATYDEVINLMEIAVLRSVETATILLTTNDRSRAQIRAVVMKELTSDDIKNFIKGMTQEELDFYKHVLEMTCNPLFNTINLKSYMAMGNVINRIVDKIGKLVD